MGRDLKEAWDRWKETENFKNTIENFPPEHRHLMTGLLWNSFYMGWTRGRGLTIVEDVV